MKTTFILSLLVLQIWMVVANYYVFTVHDGDSCYYGTYGYTTCGLNGGANDWNCSDDSTCSSCSNGGQIGLYNCYYNYQMQCLSKIPTENKPALLAEYFSQPGCKGDVATQIYQYINQCNFISGSNYTYVKCEGGNYYELSCSDAKCESCSAVDKHPLGCVGDALYSCTA